MRCLYRHRSLPVTAVILILGVTASPDHPLPGPHFLTCLANGNTVQLRWDHLGIGGQSAASLERDGEPILNLTEGDLSFDDERVSVGRHNYRLVVTVRGREIDEKRCEVEVRRGPGIDLVADGNQVTIRWELRGDQMHTSGIDVLRNGEPVAELGAAETAYAEEVPAGEYDYEVHACVLSAYQPPPPPLIVGSGRVAVGGVEPARSNFLRGDVNDDGSVNITDAFSIMAWIFGGAPSSCREATDTNGDDATDISDVVFLLLHLFVDARELPPPFPFCGPSPAEGRPCVSSHCAAS